MFIVALGFGWVYLGILLYRENLLFQSHCNKIRYSGSTLAASTPLPVMAGGMLVAFAVTRWLSWAIDLGKRKFNRIEISREKVMIGTVVLLFVILTIRNVLLASDADQQ
ncbi:MAG: hypothetical protein ACI87E_004935 [Mariniblastus sp.]|jgi:hypothetical protein